MENPSFRCLAAPLAHQRREQLIRREAREQAQQAYCCCKADAELKKMEELKRKEAEKVKKSEKTYWVEVKVSGDTPEVSVEVKHGVKVEVRVF